MSTLHHKETVLLGTTKISLVILALHSSRLFYTILFLHHICHYCLLWNYLKDIWGTKKVHCAHSQSLHKLSQDLKNRLVLVTVRPRSSRQKDHSKYPFYAYTDGRTAGKVFSLYVSDGYDCINVHSSCLEWLDELCDRKRHRLLWLYTWGIQERHWAEFLCLDTLVQLHCSSEFHVLCVRKTAKTLAKEWQNSKEKS